MGEKLELKEFRILLKKGIAGKSQKEIADNCGISQEHLNRMLNQPFIGTPSKNTLERLSLALDNVSYIDLLLACGYNEEAKTASYNANDVSDYEKRISLPAQERINLLYNDLIKSMNELCSLHVGTYKSIEDLMSIVTTLYMVEEINWHIRKKEHPINKGRYADWSVCIDIDFLIENRSYGMPFILNFYKTSNDEYLFESFSFKGKDLLENNVLSEAKLFELKTKGICVEESPYVVLDYTKSSCELLDMILNTKWVDTVVTGFGFYLEEVPEHVNEFILQHKDSFSLTDEEIDIVNRISNGSDAINVCANYANPDIDDERGYGYVIATIIHRENNIPVDYYEDEEHKFEDNPPCVMVDSECDVPNVRDIFYKYAKELGIKYIENITFQTKTIKNTSGRIKVI